MNFITTHNVSQYCVWPPYAHPITSGHDAPDELADGFPGVLLPDPVNWIYVRGTWGSVDGINDLSSQTSLHTLATCGQAMSCTRRNPGPTAPGGTQGPLHQEEPRAHCTRRNPGSTAPGGTKGPLHQEEPRVHCTRRNPGPTAPGGGSERRGTQAHCTGRNPGATATGGTQGPLHQRLTVALRTSSWYLTADRKPLAGT